MTTLFEAATMRRTSRVPAAFERFLIASLVVALAACTTLPPGSDYPKTTTTAFAEPQQTRLGKALAKDYVAHPGQSAFRVVPYGVEGLLLRTQLIRAAQRSLDIQYYIFAEDDTGKVLQQSILDAADRGVRVRLLIDDENSFRRSDAQQIITSLDDRVITNDDQLIREISARAPGSAARHRPEPYRPHYGPRRPRGQS